MDMEYAPISAVAFFMFIGQLNPESIGPLVSSAGVLGALIWYLYHTTTKTLPDITRTHNENIEKVTNRFTETLEHEREYRKAEIDALKSWIKSEASCKYNADYPVRIHHQERDGK